MVRNLDVAYIVYGSLHPYRYFADAEVKPYGVTAVPYSMPLNALTGSEMEVLDCVGECLSPMRLFMPESLAYVSETGIIYLQDV